MRMQHNIPDRVLRDMIQFANVHDVKRIILFGSRARGEHTARSDIDIAVCGGDFDAFYWDIKEKTPSLLNFDVVDFDHPVSDDLKKDIERDGVILYEKT